MEDRCLLVSFDFSHGGNCISVVGEKKGGNLTIINAFQGQDAKDLYKLLTKVEGENAKLLAAQSKEDK